MGFVSGQASVGLALDSTGNVALYFSGGPGGGVGVGGDAGLTVQGSSAPTVQDLAGPFGNLSAGGGAVAGGTIDGFGGYAQRAAYVGSWAHMVRVRQKGAGKSNQH